MGAPVPSESDLMADYEDVAGWCEYRPAMSVYNNPSNVSTVMTRNGPAFYFGFQLELGEAMTRVAVDAALERLREGR